MRPAKPRKGSPFYGLHSLFQIFPDVAGEMADYWAERGFQISDEPVRWRSAVQRPDHPADRFLHHRSNDAQVRGITIEGDRVEILLEDYHAGRMLAAVDERRGWRNHAFLPVKLIFQGVRECVAFSDREAGKLTVLRHARASALAKVDEFSLDQVVQWDDNRIVVLFSFISTSRRPSRRFTPDLVLAIDATNLVVEEGQRGAWTRRLGEDQAWLYDRFDAERGRFYWEGMDAFYEFRDQELRSRT